MRLLKPPYDAAAGEAQLTSDNLNGLRCPQLLHEFEEVRLRRLWIDIEFPDKGIPYLTETLLPVDQAPDAGCHLVQRKDALEISDVLPDRNEDNFIDYLSGNNRGIFGDNRMAVRKIHHPPFRIINFIV